MCRLFLQHGTCCSTKHRKFPFSTSHVAALSEDVEEAACDKLRRFRARLSKEAVGGLTVSLDQDLDQAPLAWLRCAAHVAVIEGICLRGSRILQFGVSTPQACRLLVKVATFSRSMSSG